jgi:Cu/Zn superoxide dismutase
MKVGDIVHEFTTEIPPHIGDMPALSSNGVTRSEMEWKHLAFAMSREIIRLRKERGGAE